MAYHLAELSVELETTSLLIFQSIIDLFSKLPNSNWKTILISLFGIAYLVIFKEILNPRIKKKIKIEFPSELVLVRNGTAKPFNS